MDVYGISLDDVKTQAKFEEEQELEFQLLSDPDGSAAGKYDVLYENRPYARRVTFVITPDGVLRAIDDSVQVATHGEDLVALLRELQGG